MSDEEEIDRATLWIKGRLSKQGTFIDEETKQAAKKIVSTIKSCAI
jgi:hypothetical protein